MKLAHDTLRLVAILCTASTLSCAARDGTGSDGVSWSLELGEVLADEERAPLTNVYRLAAHPGGFVAIVDGPPVRVLLFSPDGSTRAIGRVGGGPGEYARVDDVGFIGDSLWATDAQGSKAIVFDLYGAVLGTERIVVGPRGRFDRPAGPVRLLADGSWLASESGMSITGLLSGWVTTRPFYRVKGDSVTLVYDQPLSKSDVIGVELGGSRLEMLHPLPSGPIFHTAVDGRAHFIIGRAVATNPDSGVFSVRRLGLLGDTLWTREFRYRPTPLPAGWAENWVNQRIRRVSGSLNVSEGQVDAGFRKSVHWPAFLPPVADVRPGTEGQLWLREARPDTTDVRWLVLDSLGHELARVKAPAGFRLLLPTSTHVYGVVNNEMDVPSVVRAAIRHTGTP